MTTRHWMIVVAGSSIVFACLGVSFATAMVLAAFLISALVARPANWQEWLLLLLGAFAALPSMLLAWLSTFVFRAAMFLGHWPYCGDPDYKALPQRFHPYSEFFEYLVPLMISVALTCLFAFAVPRLSRPCRRFYCAVGGALSIWSLPIILFFLDPAGVREWFMD